MQNVDKPNISFDDMLSAPGSLLLLWAGIERSAQEALAHTNGGVLPKSAYGISAVLSAWEKSIAAEQPPESLTPRLASALRVQLQEQLDIRNGICHGLNGISSGNGDSARLTWSMNGQEHSASWHELQMVFQWLSKVPDAISIISDASPIRPASRTIARPENEEWWRNEYGIEISP